MGKAKHRGLVYTTAALLLIAALLYFFLGPMLSAAGRFLVLDEAPVPSEAVVVLSTGIEYYPRLIEAAVLFREGYADKVAINGNRKSEALRDLERKGFVPCCLWYENSLRILSLLGVPRDRVITLSAEDAYDTVSEAEAIGRELIGAGITRIIIVTSKYHTRRARHIWERSFPNRFSIRTVGARTDPYSSSGWWREGRQIRWVLSEYGAWIYYYWKKGLRLN
ncbi:MAG: YdcF family protein [Candidatus Binatia bacterium]